MLVQSLLGPSLCAGFGACTCRRCERCCPCAKCWVLAPPHLGCTHQPFFAPRCSSLRRSGSKGGQAAAPALEVLRASAPSPWPWRCRCASSRSSSRPPGRAYRWVGGGGRWAGWSRAKGLRDCRQAVSCLECQGCCVDIRIRPTCQCKMCGAVAPKAGWTTLKAGWTMLPRVAASVVHRAFVDPAAGPWSPEHALGGSSTGRFTFRTLLLSTLMPATSHCRHCLCLRHRRRMYSSCGACLGAGRGAACLRSRRAACRGRVGGVTAGGGAAEQQPAAGRTAQGSQVRVPPLSPPHQLRPSTCGRQRCGGERCFLSRSLVNGRSCHCCYKHRKPPGGGFNNLADDACAACGTF